MRNIFVFIIGKHNKRAERNLAASIEQAVERKVVLGCFDEKHHRDLEAIREEAGGYYAWGAVPGRDNERHWQSMVRGDYVLCVHDGTYRYVCQVLKTYDNPRFAERVWGRRPDKKTWRHMYFLTEPMSVDRQVAELAEPHSFLRTEYRGFAKIKEENIKELVKVHGSVDDFINRSFGVRDKVETKSDHWSEAECYFAVWAYDQLDVDRGQVKKELYRQISATIGRSEKAVEYKVQNVAFFDGRPREEKPVPEAPHAQALLREVFEWYWADRERARSLFPDYFQQFQFGMASPPHAGSAPTKKDLLSLVIEEGAPGFPASARRKRSRTLLEQGRSHFREAEPDGKLRCAVCSFATPEGVEAEIVQLHHTEPLYGLGKRGTSMGLSEAISKLIPLCPTCHQIAHVEKPPLTVGAIEKLRDP